MPKLSHRFYRRPTEQVAKELLGQKLVRVYQGKRISGTITEVEAYLGLKDRACHSFGKRRTPRTETMYLAGGHSYVYLIYGLHNCFNVVTEAVDVPEAVLIRAVEPLEGISLMQKHRNRTQLNELTTGPGKLASAFQINQKLNGVPLNSEDIFIEKGMQCPESQIVCRPRIGVDYAGDDALLPLRFYIAGSKFISKK